MDRTKSEGIIYTSLEGEAAKVVAPVFQQYGVDLPDECVLAAALDGEAVVGFLCMQPALHGEPLWIHPEYTGRVNFLKLCETLESGFEKGTTYYVFAPTEMIERMAELNGMTKLDWTVWKKVV